MLYFKKEINLAEAIFFQHNRVLLKKIMMISEDKS